MPEKEVISRGSQLQNKEFKLCSTQVVVKKLEKVFEWMSHLN